MDLDDLVEEALNKIDSMVDKEFVKFCKSVGYSPQGKSHMEEFIIDEVIVILDAESEDEN